MKKIIVFIIITSLFIPFLVFAKEKHDKYILYLDKDFLEYSNKYDLNIEHSVDERLKYYKSSHLSIRDYLIYKIIRISTKYNKATDIKDNTIFKVADLGDYYYLNNSVKIDVLSNYKNVEIKIVDSNNTSSSSIINMSSMDEFLDSDIYCYFLFRELLNDTSSELEFVSSDDYSNNNYGLIRDRVSKKVLLSLDIDDNILVFNVPENVNSSDNVSYYKLDKISEKVEIDYLSIKFYSKLDDKKEEEVNRFNQDLIFLGICAILSILIISLFIKKKGE